MDAQDQCQRGRHNADRGRALNPEPERQPADPHDHQPVEEGQRHIHLGDDPHLGLEGLARPLDRLLGIIELGALMREKFDRVDVGE